MAFLKPKGPVLRGRRVPAEIGTKGQLDGSCPFLFCSKMRRRTAARVVTDGEEHV
jgi:hypothetical protein